MSSEKHGEIDACMNDFYLGLEEVGKGLSEFRSELDGHESRVRNRISEFVDHLPKQPVRRGAGLDALVAGAFENLRTGLEKWEDAIRRDLKGREFINRFDASVIVVVAGKVKSGKSSLGNFIAGIGVPRSDTNGLAGRTARFRVHEATTGGLREPVDLDCEKGFAVDALECTSQIQEVTIGGLSWIDTPGIHSLTRENGALAKEYVANAELVLYLTSSDSTLRRSDTDELKTLLAIEKPLLIAVSRCDTVEEDLDDEGNLVSRPVPKPERALREQKAWIESQVEEADLDKVLRDRSYAFLSTRLARRAIESGDRELFEASGFPMLYKRLTEVLSRDAVALKTLEPRRRFNRLIDELVAGADGDISIARLRKTFDDVRGLIEAASGKLREASGRIVRRTILLIRPELEKLLHGRARVLDEAGGDDNLAAAVKSILHPVLARVFSDEVKEILRDMECNLALSCERVGMGWSLPEITRKYDTITVSGSTAACGRGSALGGFVGTVVGGLAFGPWGAMIGSMVGAGMGNEAGAAMAGTREIRVEVGTTVQEAIAEFGELLERQLPPAVSGLLAELSASALGPLGDMVGQVISALEALRKDLLKMRFEIPAVKE